MLAFTDDLLRAGLEGDAKSIGVLKQATGRDFTTCNHGSASPQHFHAFRGALEPLDAPRSDASTERLQWDVRRGLSIIKDHPWIPTTGPEAIVSIRCFIYDVDTGLLEEFLRARRALEFKARTDPVRVEGVLVYEAHSLRAPLTQSVPQKQQHKNAPPFPLAA